MLQSFVFGGPDRALLEAATCSARDTYPPRPVWKMTQVDKSTYASALSLWEDYRMIALAGIRTENRAGLHEHVAASPSSVFSLNSGSKRTSASFSLSFN